MAKLPYVVTLKHSYQKLILELISFQVPHFLNEFYY